MPRWLPWVWVAPAAFLAVFLAYPLAVLVTTVSGGDSASAAWARLGSATLWQVTALAVVQALASTALALLVGLPIANVVTRYRYRGRALSQALVTVPFVLPTVVVALAFRSLVGDGIAQGFVLVVIAHAYVNIAVVARIVGASWAQHDPDFENVARTLGATRWRAFVDVTLPSLRPAIVSSAAVVFVFSFTSLGIVLLLGDASTRTLESQILRQTSVLLDFPGAAATAVVQLVLVSAVLLGGAAVARRSPSRRMRPVELRALPRDPLARLAVIGVAVATYVIVLAPVSALVVSSLRANGSLEPRLVAVPGLRRRGHHEDRVAGIGTGHLARLRPHHCGRGRGHRRARRRRRPGARPRAGRGPAGDDPPRGVVGHAGPRHPARLRPTAARPARHRAADPHRACARGGAPRRRGRRARTAQHRRPDHGGRRRRWAPGRPARS